MARAHRSSTLRKRSGSLPEFAAYSWDGKDSQYIREALAGRRGEIARILEINPDDVQGQWQPAGAPPLSPAGSEDGRRIIDFEHYMAVRQAGRSALVSTLSLVLDELEGICVRSCAEVVNTQKRPSSKALYKALVDLRQCRRMSRSQLERLDPRLLGILAKYWPGGRKRFMPDHPIRAADVRTAARQALKNRTKPGRGRPKGTRSVLLRLVERLSALYESRVGKAGRVVCQVESTYRTTSKETGRFLAFCELVFDCLPEQTRKALRRNGAGSMASAIRRTRTHGTGHAA